jgi:hypothetical protein
MHQVSHAQLVVTRRSRSQETPGIPQDCTLTSPNTTSTTARNPSADHWISDRFGPLGTATGIAVLSRNPVVECWRIGRLLEKSEAQALFFLKVMADVIFGHASRNEVLNHAHRRSGHPPRVITRSQTTMPLSNGEANEPNQVLALITKLGMPLLTMGICVLFILNPDFADVVSREDKTVENITALAAALASAFCVGAAFTKFARQNRLVFFATIIVAIGFFVIAGEEISWGQRIFGFESNDWFVENNWQEETNLHNTNTVLFMALFYLGVFFVFIISPLIPKSAWKRLEGSKAAEMHVFVPGAWMMIGFIPSIGITVLDHIHPDHWAMLLASFLVLGYIYFRSSDFNLEKRWVVLPAVALILAVKSTALADYSALGPRMWFYTEWREMLVCLMLLIYSVDLLQRFRQESLPSTKHS